jgi:hypothetical protein
VARSGEWPTRFEGHEYPQTLPEPDDIRPGGPAPWSTLPSEMRSGLALALVESRLLEAKRHLSNSPVPGDPSEMDAVADATRQPITHRSAVLVALFEEGGETHVVLTRRSLQLRLHRGEIALPGDRAARGS